MDFARRLKNQNNFIFQVRNGKQYLEIHDHGAVSSTLLFPKKNNGANDY